MWFIWLIISGICIIIEIMTVGFLVFWFAIGALFAMITSLFTANVLIQTAVFLISSTILLFFTRPLASKLTKDTNTINTNAYSIIGKRGVVLKDINPINGSGQIKVGTEIWSAKSLSEKTISVGSEIEVVNIDGVKAIVK